MHGYSERRQISRNISYIQCNGETVLQPDPKDSNVIAFDYHIKSNWERIRYVIHRVGIVTLEK